jgi:hypothetical protein
MYAGQRSPGTEGLDTMYCCYISVVILKATRLQLPSCLLCIGTRCAPSSSCRRGSILGVLWDLFAMVTVGGLALYVGKCIGRFVLDMQFLCARQMLRISLCSPFGFERNARSIFYECRYCTKIKPKYTCIYFTQAAALTALPNCRLAIQACEQVAQPITVHVRKETQLWKTLHPQLGCAGS